MGSPRAFRGTYTQNMTADGLVQMLTGELTWIESGTNTGSFIAEGPLEATINAPDPAGCDFNYAGAVMAHGEMVFEPDFARYTYVMVYDTLPFTCNGIDVPWPVHGATLAAQALPPSETLLEGMYDEAGALTTHVEWSFAICASCP